MPTVDAFILPPWAWAALAWTGLLALIACFQGKLLFGRTWRIRRTDPGPAAERRLAQVVTLERPGGVTLRGWLTTDADAAPRRMLLWFGGRNEHVAWTPDLGGWLPDDMALIAFNYRSLGGSGGWPSEVPCVADAEAIAHWACERFGLGEDRLHLAGRSLGSGIAMQLAARLQGGPAGVVLITPPKSIRALLSASPLLAPLVAVLRSPLDSLAAARALRCPVLMLLAERDRRVPHSHSLALADALREAGAQVDVQTLAGTSHRSLARTPAAMARVGRALGAADHA
jgi:alpha-beta hydrolase superfamily lysophospholipase